MRLALLPVQNRFSLGACLLDAGNYRFGPFNTAIPREELRFIATACETSFLW